MSFSIPLALFDATTGANGITCTKSPVSPHFDHCDPVNAMVPLKTALASKRYSRYCLVIVQTCLDTDIFSHHVDTSGHYLDI